MVHIVTILLLYEYYSSSSLYINVNKWMNCCSNSNTFYLKSKKTGKFFSKKKSKIYRKQILMYTEVVQTGSTRHCLVGTQWMGVIYI